MSSSKPSHSTTAEDTPADAHEHSGPAKSSHRLPTNVRPTHYDLHLTPNLSTFVFQATVSIHLTVATATRTVHLNSAELKIHSADITQGSNKASATIAYNEDDETAIFTFEKELSVGDAVLHLSYEGRHNDKMRGCYRSKYQRQGNCAYMCVTQFESTDARRALPCFDEPALKASFTVALTTDAHLLAISNMPAISSTPAANGQVTHTFDRSPVMSTYLLAWCVGEFDHLEAHTEDGILVRCFTPVGKASQGQFALDCAVRILPFYNEFFQIKYPLPKVDMLAIDDFAAGAMESAYTRYALTDPFDIR